MTETTWCGGMGEVRRARQCNLDRLDAVVLKALAYDRHDRFATARELQQTIAAATSAMSAAQAAIGGNEEAETIQLPRPLVGSAPQGPARHVHARNADSSR